MEPSEPNKRPPFSLGHIVLERDRAFMTFSYSLNCQLSIFRMRLTRISTDFFWLNSDQNSVQALCQWTFPYSERLSIPSQPHLHRSYTEGVHI